MRTLILVAALSPIALVRGCQCGPSAPSASAPVIVPAPRASTSPSNQAAGRLSAAMAISDVSARDDALAHIAMDAAGASDAATATQAVAGISSVEAHDEAARRAALALSKSGQPAAAGALATKIHSIETRDATLAKIAKGETE
jgi:hypothetical protein